MTFVIDIDDTLIFSNYDKEKNKYALNFYALDEIEAVNKKYDEGHTIIIHTGRSWAHYDITKEQLEKGGVKYHELIMGKPVGIYIDADSLKSIKDFK